MTDFSFITLLLFGGVVNTFFSIVFFILLLLYVSAEEYIKSIFFILCALILLSIYNEINLFKMGYDYTIANPLDVVRMVIEYFAIGSIYSIIKYHHWLRLRLKGLRVYKSDFIKLYKLDITELDPIPDDCKDKWYTYLGTSMPYADYTIIRHGLLKPSKQISRISGWIGFWPISAVGLFIANPIQWVADALTALLQTVFKQLYTRLVSKYVNIADIE